MSSFPPIYRTYYNYTTPVYELNKRTLDVERVQSKEVVHEVTLYDKYGKIKTTKVS